MHAIYGACKGHSQFLILFLGNLSSLNKTRILASCMVAQLYVDTRCHQEDLPKVIGNKDG